MYNISENGILEISSQEDILAYCKNNDIKIEDFNKPVIVIDPKTGNHSDVIKNITSCEDMFADCPSFLTGLRVSIGVQYFKALQHPEDYPDGIPEWLEKLNALVWDLPHHSDEDDEASKK